MEIKEITKKYFELFLFEDVYKVKIRVCETFFRCGLVIVYISRQVARHLLIEPFFLLGSRPRSLLRSFTSTLL